MPVDTMRALLLLHTCLAQVLQPVSHHACERRRVRYAVGACQERCHLLVEADDDARRGGRRRDSPASRLRTISGVNPAVGGLRTRSPGLQPAISGVNPAVGGLRTRNPGLQPANSEVNPGVGGLRREYPGRQPANRGVDP